MRQSRFRSCRSTPARSREPGSRSRPGTQPNKKPATFLTLGFAQQGNSRTLSSLAPSDSSLDRADREAAEACVGTHAPAPQLENAFTCPTTVRCPHYGVGVCGSITGESMHLHVICTFPVIALLTQELLEIIPRAKG